MSPCDNHWSVYVHELKFDVTRVYIGITGRNPKSRWANGAGYTSGHFHNAIKRYGFDSFNHIVLMDNLSENMAKLLEIELIKYFRNHDYHVYNLSSGGDCNNGRKGQHNSINHNLKIGNANRGRKLNLSDAQRDKLIQNCKTRKSGWYSVEGAKSPFSKLTGSLNNRAHKVYVFDLDGNFLNSFDTIREASIAYNVAEQYISTCCRGRIHKTHGYKFSYSLKGD